jgi:hypothetical protein
MRRTSLDWWAGPWLLVLPLLLGLAGCTGQLVHSLHQRNVTSCIWWHSQFGLIRGVSSTGGVPVSTCLNVPSQLP